MSFDYVDTFLNKMLRRLRIYYSHDLLNKYFLSLWHTIAVLIQVVSVWTVTDHHLPKLNTICYEDLCCCIILWFIWMFLWVVFVEESVKYILLRQLLSFVIVDCHVTASYLQ